LNEDKEKIIDFLPVLSVHRFVIIINTCHISNDPS